MRSTKGRDARDEAPAPPDVPRRLPAAVLPFVVLLLGAGVVAGFGLLCGEVVRGGRGDAAAAAAAPPRDPVLVEGIHRLVGHMRDGGVIAAIRDGDPTVVVVTDQYLRYSPGLERDLPLYDGHFVGFADEYAWLVNGTHRVRLLREDGTEIGRRDGAMSDAQVQAIYLENRRLRDAATAGVG